MLPEYFVCPLEHSFGGELLHGSAIEFRSPHDLGMLLLLNSTRDDAAVIFWCVTGLTGSSSHGNVVNVLSTVSQKETGYRGKYPLRVIARIVVPYLTPPSVNHYKKPAKIRTSTGIRNTFIVTPEGKAFKAAVAIFAQGQSISPATPAERKRVKYALYVTVVHGPGEWGDGDNYWKCIADGLQEAGVIHSDARVKRWFLEVVDDDRQNPRTEIRATVIRGSL